MNDEEDILKGMSEEQIAAELAEFDELLKWVCQHNSTAKPQDKIVVDVEAGTADYAVKRSPPKVGRNDPCPCGSGKKYKKCCGS